MNRQTTLAKNETFEPQWIHVDATDQVVGRLAASLAMALQGKHKPTYTPHVDTGDFVVVTNAAKLVLTGNKATQKFHQNYSGYTGGLKYTRYDKLMAENPEFLLTLAVKRMLPKNKLGRKMLTKLKVFAGEAHEHTAQKPVTVDPKTFAAVEAA